LVEPATSIPALFIMAEAVNPVGAAEEDDNYPIVRSGSPYNMHQACSRLMYGLRATYLVGMSQGLETNNLPLSNYWYVIYGVPTCR
jgi:hypothetical protein